MSSRANYYKIGLFVIAGSVILASGIVVLGAGAIFQKRIPMETYIQESVQGLDVGSPVKYLGVRIGNVKRITFVEAVYDTTQPYVYIAMNLNTAVFGDWTELQMRDRLKKEIDRGLRIRLASQGLTGAAYLELDYHDPLRNPPLPIEWEPQHYYIPSAPSLITRVTESVDQVFRRLEKTHIEQVVSDLDTFLVTLTDAVKQARVEQVREETVGLLGSLRKSSERLQGLLQKPDLDTLPGDVSGLVASARRTTENTEHSIDDILQNLRNVTAKLDSMGSQIESFLNSEELQAGLKDAARTTENVRAASKHLPDTAASLASTLARIDLLVARQQRDVQSILQNLNTISQNLKELTDDAKRYPSRVLFGEPPARPEVNP